MIQLIKSGLLIMLLSLPVYGMAQGFEDEEDVVDVPLDGGVSALAVAGVAYGIKRLKDARKK